MSIADMIPSLDDKALAVLRANATRAEAGDHASRRDQAAALIPLIEAELAAREALKPPKKTPVRKKPVAKAAGDDTPKPKPKSRAKPKKDEAATA